MPWGLYFSKAIFERLIFGGLIYGAEICVSKSIGLGTKFTIFALFFFVFEGNFQVEVPGGHIFGGAILEGLIQEGTYLGNFTVYMTESVVFYHHS